MIKLDDNLLAELGLARLPEDEKKKMLAHIYETLEMRVGMELAKQMTDAQLAEFEQFINRNDEAGALRWLETNFPNYKDVVAAEFEKLKAEIRQLAPQILTDGSNGQQQQPSAAAYPQPYAVDAPAMNAATAPAQYGPMPLQPPTPNYVQPTDPSQQGTDHYQPPQYPPQQQPPYQQPY